MFNPLYSESVHSKHVSCVNSLFSQSAGSIGFGVGVWRHLEALDGKNLLPCVKFSCWGSRKGKRMINGLIVEVFSVSGLQSKLGGLMLLVQFFQEYTGAIGVVCRNIKDSSRPKNGFKS